MIETASMRTRDGVRLDADIYRPAAPGIYPVLLMRQPYGRAIASTICYAHPTWYAARGYIVVIQDVRGRGSSEGTFRLFRDDARDGYDAIDWASQLPGSSGAVGMYGFSYQGTNQLLAAALAPPALKALAPAMIGWNLYRDWAYENGAFMLRPGLGWAIQLAAESARLAGDDEAYRDLCAAAGALPLADLVPARPELMERYRRYTHYFDWLDEPEDAPYWSEISPSTFTPELAAHGPPMLFVGGWYDTHLRGTLDAYHALAPAVPAQLVVGPWTHAPWVRRVGALDFGTEAIGEIDQLQVRWFDRWLKDEEGDADAPVRLFDLGTREWADLPAWPALTQRFALASGGRAALDERDGVLQLDPPPRVIVDYVVHDPWRPAPVHGGAYGSPPGPIVADLHVSSSAADFDLACVLSRVFPDGRSFELASGYRRVCTGTARERIAVPMRATCATLDPGDALRLSISGAAFPAYPVNPGSGADPTAAPRSSWQIITLGVHCGGSDGSALVVSRWS